MGSESALASQKDSLEASKRQQDSENEQKWKLTASREQQWTAERQDLNNKLQEMVLYNEKVRDECLKKIVSYKEKYT